jgi:hypothetical protein
MSCARLKMKKHHRIPPSIPPAFALLSHNKLILLVGTFARVPPPPAAHRFCTIAKGDVTSIQLQSIYQTSIKFLLFNLKAYQTSIKFLGGEARMERVRIRAVLLSFVFVLGAKRPVQTTKAKRKISSMTHYTYFFS